MNWDFKELEDVASITSGSTPTKSIQANWGGEIPWLSAKDLKTFWLRDSIDHITESAVANGTRLAPTGAVLVLVRGMTLMKTLPVGVTTRPVAFNQDLKAIVPDQSVVDSEFLGNYIAANSERIRASVTIAGHGTGRLPLEALTTFPVPTPPLAEQRKVADVFSTWDRAIETLETLIDAKFDRKRSLLQQLLTSRKRLPGSRRTWPVKKLGDLVQNSAATNRGKHGWDRLYGVTKAEGMTPMREHVRGVSNERCKLVEPGWFAYNPMRLNIGSLARWQGDDEVMVSGDYVVFRCLDGKLDPRFFDHLRRSRPWSEFVNKSGSGSVRVRLYFKDIASFKFSCPPVEEQTAIADLLDTCDRELALHRHQLEALREQKRGLMQKVLTGEISVNI